MTTHDLRIQGMSCAHCVKTVDAALRAVPGVTRVTVEIGHAGVESDASVSREILAAALAAAGYPAA